MKRFVSYLYSIYNNQKIHNAGFARIELRTERNRVDIHLKENGYSGKTGTVYLFIRKQKNIQGISIGNITFRGNQADFRYEQAEENIGQTPWQIMQMNGILIVIDDRPAFLSQWDEQPVDTTRFEVWNADKRRQGQDIDSKNKETVRPVEARTESVPQSKKQPAALKRRSEQGVPKSVHPSPPQEDRLEPLPQTEESVSVPLPHSEEGVSVPLPHAEESASVPLPHSEEGASIPLPHAEEGASVPLPHAEERTAVPAPRPKQDVSVRVKQNGENALGYASARISPLENEQMPVLEGQLTDAAAEPSEQKILAGQTNMEGTAPAGQSVNIQTAELQPQLQTQWSQTWRYMLRMYPVLNHFTDRNHVLCVRIEIKDVRLLPEKYWSIVNNSFLLHGFFNYRYLVFGRMDQNWFIGIPGIYQNQEHVMASIFGFPDFLPQKEKTERGEQPGYWYRILEI